MADEQRLNLARQIEREVTDYLTRPVSIGQDHDFSQHALVRRIGIFENHIYPTGKFDAQGNYKYWLDIISSRIDAEVKNIDFDTKNIEAYSPRTIDEVPSLIVNLKVTEWLRENGQAEEINSAIEEGAGWGNIVWKKVKGTYERVDLRNFYVINQTASSLNQTPVVERHQLSQTELRGKSGKWEYVQDVIEKCGANTYKKDAETPEQETTTPYYNIYERNGEVCVRDLKEFRSEEIKEGDAQKYVLAKVITAGVEGANGGVKIKYVLFAQEITKMPYKEYHRSRYKGRWWREGLYELLFDLQVRANEVGNQLAQGLQYASKVIFTDEDRSVVQNILTDLSNGDFIRSKNLRQVEVRMQGFDQLANEWNRVLEMANEIANSREIVQGEAQPGQPFRLGALLNINANKLFDFIREKLSIPFREIFEDWVIPTLIDDLNAEEVLRLTGDSDMLRRLHELIVDDWYLRNLIAIGPHTAEVGEQIKAAKLDELKNKTTFLKEFKDVFEGYKPRVSVVITGENVDLQSKLQTLATFIQLETDPVRRSHLVEKAMRMAGVDVGALPRSTPEQLAGVRPEQPSTEEEISAPNNDLAAPAAV